MNVPKVSVVFPVYNAEEYLSESLRAVLDQSETDLEIIAVNDGSKDRSLEILQQFAALDGRIKVVSQANAGLSVARNTGMEHASGTWIAFVDSDDWLEPRALEQWLGVAEAGDLQVLVGNGFSFSGAVEQVKAGERLPIVQKVFANTAVVSGRDWIVASVEQGKWPHYAWLQFLRRDFVEGNALRFQPGLVHEDILWTMNLALCAQKIGFLDIPLYGYRINPNSITGSVSLLALERRAQGYLFVIGKMVAAAKSCSDLPLRKALLRQVNTEAGHFFALLRKRLAGSQQRRTLAARFAGEGLLSAMFAGARNGSEYWRAMRCWLVLTWMSRV